MNTKDYRRTLTAARKDLSRLYEQRESLERRIARVRQAVTTLTLIVDEKPGYRLHQAQTLTEAVELALGASNRPMTVGSICDLLEQTGFKTKSSNFGASVHSVLARLIQQKRVRMVHRISNHKGPDDKWGRQWDPTSRAYWWGERNPPKPWGFPTLDDLRAEANRRVQIGMEDDAKRKAEQDERRAQKRRTKEGPAKK